MKQDHSLTNEQFNDRFENPFSLVKYAISLAQQGVARGEGLERNLANDILTKISKSEDLLQDVQDDEEEDEAAI